MNILFISDIVGKPGRKAVAEWLPAWREQNPVDFTIANGENAAGVDTPDLWIGSTTIDTRIDENWSLLWETKAYVGSESSSYRRAYVCPGIAWTGGHLTIGASAFVPVYRKGVVNASSRFDVDWAPYVRVYYRFF